MSFLVREIANRPFLATLLETLAYLPRNLRLAPRIKSDPCVTSVDGVSGITPKQAMSFTGRGSSSHFNRPSYRSEMLGTFFRLDTFRNQTYSSLKWVLPGERPDHDWAVVRTGGETIMIHTVLKETGMKGLNASIHSTDFSLRSKSSLTVRSRA